MHLGKQISTAIYIPHKFYFVIKDFVLFSELVLQDIHIYSVYGLYITNNY